MSDESKSIKKGYTPSSSSSWAPLMTIVDMLSAGGLSGRERDIGVMDSEGGSEISSDSGIETRAWD